MENTNNQDLSMTLENMLEQDRAYIRRKLDEAEKKARDYFEEKFGLKYLPE